MKDVLEQPWPLLRALWDVQAGKDPQRLSALALPFPERPGKFIAFHLGLQLARGGSKASA